MQNNYFLLLRKFKKWPDLNFYYLSDIATRHVASTRQASARAPPTHFFFSLSFFPPLLFCRLLKTKPSQQNCRKKTGFEIKTLSSPW